MSINIHLTQVSSNRKVGRIPVTTTGKKSCPDACPFKDNGCYADNGPLLIHWRKVSREDRGQDWRTALASLKTSLPDDALWRHNQAGDGIPDDEDSERISHEYADALIDANDGRKGWSYTHYDPLHSDNAATIKRINDGGFAMNMSANTLEHADELSALDCGPVVVTLDADDWTYDQATGEYSGARSVKTPEGRTVSVCPAQLHEDVTCESCGLCQVSSRKRSIVGFIAHGRGAKKVNAVCKA
jgi:hypothetical protein